MKAALAESLPEVVLEIAADYIKALPLFPGHKVATE